MALTAPTNDLTGNQIATTYDQLLILDSLAGIVENTLKIVSTQTGHSALQLDDEKVLIKGVDTSNTKAFEVQAQNGKSLLRVNANVPALVINEDSVDMDFRVESNGNVNMLFVDGGANMVGIGTAAPAANLHLVDSSADNPMIIIDNENATDAAQGGTLKFIRRDSSGATLDDAVVLGDVSFGGTESNGTTEHVGAFIRAETAAAWDDTNSPTELQFFTTNTGEVANLRLTIDRFGWVGIGIAPESLLHIKSGTSELRYEPYGSYSFEQISDAEMKFSVADRSSKVTAMTINEAGNVGIGATGPGYPLEVVGTGSGGYVAHFDNSNTASTSHGIRISAGDTDHADSDTHYILFEESDGGDVGELDSDGGALALSDTSDYRLKENINLISGGLAKVNALKPSTFNYKKYPNKVHDGFIAHEVVDAGIGYAVKGDKDAVKDDGSVKPQLFVISHLIPQMVSAIQELSAKVTALENA